MGTVTCRTEGCGNKDIPIELQLTVTDADGTVRQIMSVICGVCSQPIHDIIR
jgi:hypothetical protein